MDKKIRIGVSSCLLGNPVRYDGGHQHDPFISQTLGRFFEFVVVCPEAECGLGVPRETMRLVGDPQKPRLVTTKTCQDHTERMSAWAQQRVTELKGEELCGFIFKSKSPSSGMQRVKVYPLASGAPKRVGVGLFARVFMEHFSLLPVEDEDRLHDVGLRENFIERIFACQRWRSIKNDTPTANALISFHARHKLQIMAHSIRHYQIMGRLVAQAKEKSLASFFDEYEGLLMEALRLLPTVKKQANVLFHVLGYFKKQLSAAEKQELLEIIDQYRDGSMPLSVPITLLNHYVRKYQQEYLAGQYYLHPHPLERNLRNHA